MPLEFKMYSYIGPEPLRTNFPLLPATRKSTASFSAQSPTPNGLPPPPEFANSYQLDIISALRGNDHDFLTRSAVADAIFAIENEENKLKLIDFLAAEQGAIALTLENNACKLFECTPIELYFVAQREENEKEKFLTKLVELFHTVLRKIIPNTFGMLYPLQQFDSTFQIREIILHYFRDRVLLSLLDNFHFDRSIFESNTELQANLRQMLLMINLDVRDESDENDCFSLIIDDFLGQTKQSWKKRENSKSTSDEFADDERTYSPVRKIGISIKPTGSRGRRMARTSRSVANSIDKSPPNDPENESEMRKSTVEEASKFIGHRNRKSFSPSPKLFMAKEEKEEEKSSSAEIVRKVRSRTMPTKTVTFWDDETTVDV